MHPLTLSGTLKFRVISTIVILKDISFINGYIRRCYLQFKKGKFEYFIVSKVRKRLITDNTMAYEIIKRLLKN
jgi:hypothetical protein